MRHMLSVAFGIICTVIPISYALAHDLVETGGRHYAWNSARLSHLPTDPIPASGTPNTIAPRYVLVIPNRWPVGQTLQICFYGGPQPLREKILQVAALWLKYGNLKFDSGGNATRSCVTNDRSEIRIGFSEPGYWSYIGTDSLSSDLVTKNLASMNLQGFDIAPPAEPRFTGVILHEFGHALGFHHEHQSPAGGCDQEYDWPKLYAYYLQNYGWNMQMVDVNVRQLLADRRAYDWSQPDPKSVMLYASDPQFLLRGTASKCYFLENDSLSSLDQQGMSHAYPFGNERQSLQDQIAVLNALKQTATPGRLSNILNTQLQLTQARLRDAK